MVRSHHRRHGGCARPKGSIPFFSTTSPCRRAIHQGQETHSNSLYPFSVFFIGAPDGALRLKGCEKCENVYPSGTDPEKRPGILHSCGGMRCTMCRSSDHPGYRKAAAGTAGFSGNDHRQQSQNPQNTVSSVHGCQYLT